jgi:hypothetical protein
MSIALEAYTTEGLLTGSVVVDGRLVDLLASFSSVVVENPVLVPFDGPPQRTGGWASVDVDDLLGVVASPDTIIPFHANWHAIRVELGPFRICGELPALPGFDPSRALARPSGAFILLGHVTVELIADGPNAGLNAHPYVWINRYAVDTVVSQLELGFFFPGALDSSARVAAAIA